MSHVSYVWGREEREDKQGANELTERHRENGLEPIGCAITRVLARANRVRKEREAEATRELSKRGNTEARLLGVDKGSGHAATPSIEFK